MNTLKAPQVYGEVMLGNIDVQNDFCPGGTLAVRDGDKVVGPLNAVGEFVAEHDGFVFNTGDFHDPRTAHFDTNGGPWPVHCVEYRAGAAFHEDLTIRPNDSVAYKGTSLVDDGYSGAEAVIQRGRLESIVSNLPTSERTIGAAIERIEQVTEQRRRRLAVLIGGLATDYCVKATVLDVLAITNRETTDVIVLRDAIRAVNINETDGEDAINAMLEAGALAMTTEEILAGGIVIDHARLER